MFGRLKSGGWFTELSMVVQKRIYLSNQYVEPSGQMWIFLEQKEQVTDWVLTKRPEQQQKQQ